MGFELKKLPSKSPALLELLALEYNSPLSTPGPCQLVAHQKYVQYWNLQ